ncbi:MAG: aspartate-semialdehyde dehydrogenase [Spirochaetia bacterium]
MAETLRVGIIGATGMVGQNYIRLLSNHPRFKITHLAASERSAGKTYREAAGGRWQMTVPIPDKIKDMRVADVRNIEKAAENCDFIFSAVSLGKNEIRELEQEYARAEIPVVSNNSAHRTTPWVPMIIPEVNPEHLKLIPLQQEKMGWKTGFIVTKPNCSIQGYMLALAALRARGFYMEALHVSNYQALSGSGYPGVSALDVTDNIYHLPGEEEKNEWEPKKIFGTVTKGVIKDSSDISISASCVRVGVSEGHMSNVSVLFRGGKPKKEQLLEAFRTFRGLPQELGLPSAPLPPLVYLDDENAPQPKRDRWTGDGMAAAVGRMRECPVFHWKFTSLTSNTVRGAAGGAVLTAELLAAKGYINKSI